MDSTLTELDLSKRIKTHKQPCYFQILLITDLSF